jgi:hypothetical protein
MNALMKEKKMKELTEEQLGAVAGGKPDVSVTVSVTIKF